MKISFNPVHRRWASVTALACLSMCMNAHAAVSAPASTDGNGEMFDIAYGAGGNLFQLTPLVFISGLGSTSLPDVVTGRSFSLSYSFGVEPATVGSNMLVVDYSITNIGLVETFSNLRFSVIANPDGDNVDYLDTVSEAWGAAQPNGPVAREAREFTFDPALTISSKTIESGGLLNGAPGGACASGASCDAVFGLEWNAASLKPGETFKVRVGLSSNGSSLSSRFLTATSVIDPSTSLTFSGLATVTTAVPEASSVAMLLAGLAMLGLVRSRRKA